MVKEKKFAFLLYRWIGPRIDGREEAEFPSDR